MVEDGDQAVLERDLAAVPDYELGKEASAISELTYPLRVLPKLNRNSFWDEDEPDPDLVSGEDTDEFKEDDMTEMAHAKLDEIREQRAYARIAIWEMPLLSQYAKPFVPPTAEQPLRFRYTSYMGEYHPAEKKVVVEFSPADFGLTEGQQLKMIKLAGARFNPAKRTIKMSSESFEHQAQNKRYLAETVEKLVADAKDPTDDFADVPLDMRHYKIKTKPKFPKEWRMSEERMEQIKDYRNEVKRIEDYKKVTDKLIDGTVIINKSLSKPRTPKAVPELVAVRPQRQPRARP
ncbi:mitochondrial ribosomal subunit protein-domain-containing protein [Coniella lustricola]|uniref:Mitochondrial ribosomal subunit protein-domain-containing protein n=1 Tax=Coniella lustricola TaxID=2025994 RepID=A0A2T3AI32_9PEZI|nr:mitochondrial ribosomal subunit protein-domain-containing protein [Coniella lustricola]